MGPRLWASLISFFFMLCASRALALETPKPSLLLEDDIPAKTGDYPARVMKSYALVADFFTLDKPEKPRKWIDGKKDPKTGLLFGKPSSLLRLPIELKLVEFSPGKISYFKGDDPLLTELNAVVTYWNQKRFQQAYDGLQAMKEKIQPLPPSHVVGVTAKLFRGLFLVFLSQRADIQVKDGNGTVLPAELHHHNAQAALWGTLAKLDFAQIATSLDTSIDRETFDSFWKHPYAFEKDTLVVGKKYDVELRDRAIDPLLWVRSVALHCYWNVTVGMRAFKAWDQFLVAGDKFHDVIARLENSFPVPPAGPAMLKPAHALARSDVQLSPRNHRDMQASLYLANALVEMDDVDPQPLLVYSDKAIRRAASPEIAALAFYLVGNVYFDLNNFRLARRAYAWSEAVSPNYTSSQPSNVLYGAEAAFWYGQYDVAKAGFERFLELTGDSQFGPRARLRLGEIAQITGDSTRSEERYEEIVRHYPQHEVAKDARVRLFCANVPKLGKFALQKAYQEVITSIVDGSDALKSQAKACLLMVDLKNMAADSSTSKNESFADAKKQLSAIEKYKEEFPESEYLQLFSDRTRKLKLSEGLYLASEAKCRDFVKMYKKHRNEFESVGKNNAGLLNSLSWGAPERKLVLRCAALLRDVPLAKTILKSDAKADNPKIYKPYFNFVASPNDKTITLLFESIKASDKSDWVEVVSETEKSRDKLIRSSDFWRQLAVRTVLTFELSSPAKKKPKLMKSIAGEIMRKPQLVHESDVLCSWTLALSPGFQPWQWDKLAKGTKSEDWLELAAEEDTDALECRNLVAKRLIGASLAKPSAYRDSQILLPYLNEVGMKDGAEHWLDYAKRRAAAYGPLDKRTREIFAKLKRDASEIAVREAARAWIEKNVEPNTSLL